MYPQICTETGQTLLIRMLNEGQNYDTYYVYDKYGNFCFVLPPKVSDVLTSNSTWNADNEMIQKLGYAYKYDKYNRMIWKKLPGCEPIDYIYDKADRLIFWRDDELKKQEKWMFSLPDKFGRVVLTGTCEDISVKTILKLEQQQQIESARMVDFTTFSAWIFV